MLPALPPRISAAPTRTLTVVAALLSALLAACASTTNPPGKRIEQSGSLKVHPGLLGQPVPPGLQGVDAPSAAPRADGAPGVPAEKKAGPADEASLRAQRSIYFDLNSVELKTEFANVLQAHARHLARNPGARIRLEGHADERGPADYNRRLGLKRADVVRQSLIEQGAAEGQIRMLSLGESKPRSKGHDEESWAENRRTDLVYEME